MGTEWKEAANQGGTEPAEKKKTCFARGRYQIQSLACTGKAGKDPSLNLWKLVLLKVANPGLDVPMADSIKGHFLYAHRRSFTIMLPSHCYPMQTYLGISSTEPNWELISN